MTEFFSWSPHWTKLQVCIGSHDVIGDWQIESGTKKSVTIDTGFSSIPWMTRLLAVLLIGLLFDTGYSTETEWDQQKAKEMVEEILNVENEGLPWDNINWLTDTKGAVSKARETNKPIFAFLYMKTGAGPREAPC